MYILDTNVLIEFQWAKFFEPSERCFREWLKSVDSVRIPKQVIKELNNKQINDWLSQNMKTKILPDEHALQEMNNILNAYQAITNEEIANSIFAHTWADPYIIAHAKVENACVVTEERNTSQLQNPPKIIKNVKIPLVCEYIGIRCINVANFLWENRITMSNF